MRLCIENTPDLKRSAQYILKLSRSNSEESYDLHQGLAFFLKTCHILSYLVISRHFLSWSIHVGNQAFTNINSNQVNISSAQNDLNIRAEFNDYKT